MIPTYRPEKTGDPVLDRIQAGISRAIDAIRALDARVQPSHTETLAKAFTNTETRLKAVGLGFVAKKGEVWLLEFKGNAGCSGSADGMKFGVLGPAGTGVAGALDTSLGAATTDSHVQLTAINVATSAVHTVDGGTRDDEGYAIVTMFSDGVIDLGIQPTTATNIATLSAKSWVRSTRIAVV